MISQILDINTVKADQRGIPDTLQATRCIRDAPLVCLSGLRLREVPNNLYILRRMIRQITVLPIRRNKIDWRTRVTHRKILQGLVKLHVLKVSLCDEADPVIP